MRRMRLGSLRTENLSRDSAEVSREGQTGDASHASRYQAKRIAYRIPQNNLENFLYSMRPSRFQVTRPREVQTEVSMQIRIFPYMVAASIGVLLAFAYVFGQ